MTVLQAYFNEKSRYPTDDKDFQHFIDAKLKDQGLDRNDVDTEQIG
jgi:hypothetical protein